MMKDRKYKILCFLAALLGLTLAVYFGSCKKGYYIDEYYTYTLANGNQLGISVEAGGWQDTSQVWDQMTSDSEEAFRFSQVYDSTSNNVHPPLYYYLIHFASSFIPGRFSKWTGLIVNLVLWIPCLFIAAGLSKELAGKSRALAFVAFLAYCASPAIISGLMLIRMYVPLHLFTMLYAWLIVKDIKRDRLSVRGFLIPVFITGFLGFMTQYYFVIIMFFLTFFYMLFMCAGVIWKYRPLPPEAAPAEAAPAAIPAAGKAADSKDGAALTQETSENTADQSIDAATVTPADQSIDAATEIPADQSIDAATEIPADQSPVAATEIPLPDGGKPTFDDFKRPLAFGCTALLSLIATYFYWPVSVYHIFKGYRGADSFSALVSTSSIIDRLRLFFGNLNENVFGGLIMFPVVCLLFGLLVLKKRGRRGFYSARQRAFVILGAAASCYFLVITKIGLKASYASNRYEYPVYGIIIILSVIGIFEMIRRIIDRRVALGSTVLIIASCILAAYAQKQVLFLYTEEAELESFLINNPNTELVVFFSDVSKVDVRIKDYMDRDRVYWARSQHPEDLEDDELKEKDELLVYIEANKAESSNDLIALIKNNPELVNIEYVFTSPGGDYEMWYIGERPPKI